MQKYILTYICIQLIYIYLLTQNYKYYYASDEYNSRICTYSHIYSFIYILNYIYTYSNIDIYTYSDIYIYIYIYVLLYSG